MSQLGSLEALGQFMPVVLAQDRLHGDQVLTGEAGDRLGEDGDQFTPRREVLEVLELMIFQRPHQEVADLFGIEVPSIGQPAGQVRGCRGLARTERSVEPDDHARILSLGMSCGRSRSFQGPDPLSANHTFDLDAHVTRVYGHAASRRGRAKAAGPRDRSGYS
jgi:hypothetical protein